MCITMLGDTFIPLKLSIIQSKAYIINDDGKDHLVPENLDKALLSVSNSNIPEIVPKFKDCSISKRG